MSTGRAQAACSDPIAGCGGLQGESLLVDGALRIRAHLHGEQRQGHGERGWWPWELGRSSRLPCKRQQALAGSKLDCGWQGALAHRQLAVAVAAHPIATIFMQIIISFTGVTKVLPWSSLISFKRIFSHCRKNDSFEKGT